MSAFRRGAYIEEIEFLGNWYPGKHEALVDRVTWDRVQMLLGDHVYCCREMTCAGEFIRYGYCRHPITGEYKTKRFKIDTELSYICCCACYTKPGHPRTRIPEADFDYQILALFDKRKVEDESVREWFQAVLVSKMKDSQSESLARRAERQRQQTLLVEQQDRLRSRRLSDDIDQAIFAR